MLNKEHIDEAFKNAENEKSKLITPIFQINGMSSAKVRCLLNNLLNIDNVKYLEIGMWRGSTLISALYGNNPKTVVGIDNFSEFVLPHPTSQEWLFLTDIQERRHPVHPRDELFHNLQEFLPPENKISILEGGCFNEELLKKCGELSPFNIYFYDGNHSYESQKRAMTEYVKFMDKTFIIIVDDWNASDASKGTLDGLAECGVKIIHKVEKFTNFNCDRETWWNGIGVLLCEQ